MAALGLHRCMQAFSSCGEQGLLFVAVRGLITAGFSLRWLLLLQSMGSRCASFSSCGAGLVVLRHVGSSPTSARTRVACIGWWILNHSATREALTPFFVFCFV